MLISAFHNSLLQAKPSDTQKAFYESGLNGFAGSDQDSEKFIATLMKALYSTRWDNGSQKPWTTVVLAVPKNLEPWALGLINNTMVDVVKRNKAIHSQKVMDILKESIRESISKLVIGSRVLAIAEPKDWVAFGFEDDSKTPEWIRNKLYTDK